MAEKKHRNLTTFERETIIAFNEGEPLAEIYTHNKVWQQHLEKKLGIKPFQDNGWGGRTYQIDKKRIKPPRAPLKLSVEARKQRGERLAKTRSKVSKHQQLFVLEH